MSRLEKDLNTWELEGLAKAMRGGQLEIARQFVTYVFSTGPQRRREKDKLERLLEIRKTYDSLVKIWDNYAQKALPSDANRSVRLMADALRSATGKGRDLSRVPTGAIDAIITDSRTKWVAAAEGGFRRVEALMSRDPTEIAALFATPAGASQPLLRATKQLNVAEGRINNALASSLLRESALRPAAASIERELVSNLINGKVLVVTRAGKDAYYAADSYAELVARTRGREAQTLGAVQTLRDYGQDLILISDHNTDTEVCQEFEGNVYSLSGNTPGYPIADQLPPYHPNCLHVVLPYVA